MEIQDFDQNACLESATTLGFYFWTTLAKEDKCRFAFVFDAMKNYQSSFKCNFCFEYTELNIASYISILYSGSRNSCCVRAGRRDGAQHHGGSLHPQGHQSR
mgnify:CR=1 FL=1